jgi:hypothetical protein
MSEEQKQTAQTLFEEGKKAFASGNYESSATQLGQACQLL